MKVLLDAIFKGLAVAFDSIPLLSKLKGYRSAFGLILMGILPLVDKLLEAKGIGPWNLADTLQPYLLGFTGLSLLARNPGTQP